MRGWFLGFALLALGCDDQGKKSAELAREQVRFLADAMKEDLTEVRSGLPLGAAHLVPLLREAHPEPPSFEKASGALDKARDKVPELRVAKSTFFALVGVDGVILRRDGKTDPMAGKSLFEFYPELRGALTKDLVETMGSMPEAAGVRGRSDSQWVVATPVRDGERTLGLYATGWSWSSYAYRLETALRSKLLVAAQKGDKVPLVYVYLAVRGSVYGAPISPEVSAKRLVDEKILEKSSAKEVYSTTLEIDGRWFGLASLRPSGIDEVAIVVLRSET